MTHRVRFRDETELSVAEGESILDAALREGIGLAYGCRNGVCRSCMAPVTRGSVRYPEGQPKGLSDEEQAAGYTLLCQARPLSDLVIDVTPTEATAQPRTLAARVAHMEQLAPDVYQVFLSLPEGQRLPFRAGQYIDVLLSDGGRRSFSLANAPEDDHYLELHIRHVPGGRFTEYVFSSLKPGTPLRIEGPLGQFYLRSSERPAILVGGGTGFGPLKAILDHAFHQGVERPLHLFWGARDRAGLYMHEHVEALAQAHANLIYTPVLSEPQPDDAWAGRTGWVHEAVLADYPDLAGYQVYMSGPPPMTDAAAAAFTEHGLDAEELFFDAFHFSHE